MRLASALLACAALLAAGCVTTGAKELVEPAAAAPEPEAWNGETLALPMPAGDGYGILEVPALAQLAAGAGGEPRYGIAIDAGSIEAGLTHLEVFYASPDPPELSAYAWSSTPAGLVSVAYAWDEDPGPLVVMVATHLETPALVRVGPWTDETAAIEEAGSPANWSLSGAAEISYLLSGVLLNNLSLEATSYGFEASTTGVSNGAAMAGEARYRSAHEGEAGAAYQAATAIVLGTGPTAARVDVAFEADDVSERASYVALTPSPAGLLSIAGGSFAGGAQGASSLTATITGASTLPAIILKHVSVPVDLAALGVDAQGEWSDYSLPLPIEACAQPVCEGISLARALPGGASRTTG